MSFDDYNTTKQIIDSEFASRLKLNTATQDIYLDDAPFDIY